MIHVTIMRKWNNPEITIQISDQSIKLNISLKDFLKALVDEAAEPLVRAVATESGNPFMLMTNNQLTERLVNALEGAEANLIFQKAAETVIDSIKMESNKVF
jgi:hypothetical protein